MVVKGYAQMFGVDFSETFAPIARLDTIRMLLALAAQKGWNIHQMDVKSAFLNGYLEEEIFVEQLKVLLFKEWNRKKVCDETLVVSLYVDDLLVTGSSMEQIDNFKKERKDVDMIDLGRMTFFLGMECNSMNQNEKFCKENGAAKADERLYRTIIECLMYLTATRLDLMNVVSSLSRYMHCASEIHFQAAKRIVRYVKGTIDYGLRFCQVKNFTLHGYSDSDWAGYVDDMRITSSYCFSFDSTIFSWCSKKKEVIAQSTVEAEYVVVVVAVNQAL
ncbi:Copia protein [Vitis vinifera]|uniref:Copia protein n=1 Tax=Vitis vinifera TaxID=29760 RepID=A0A438CN51_VITVI|nr:Copia protein [Vitis vinifera]